jgi:hypothetical protein
MSLHDALEIWQQGFGGVQEKMRPAGSEDPEAAFVQYIREKIHLLKRRQAAGAVKNSTGFLRDAIKKNFANPEFAEEQARQEAQQQAQARKTQARELATLEAQKTQARHRYEEALHTQCLRMIEASPVLLREAVAALREKQATFWLEYDPDTPPLEDYRRRPSLYVPVETFLAQRHPEHFQALHAAHHAELAALDEKLAFVAP